MKDVAPGGGARRGGLVARALEAGAAGAGSLEEAGNAEQHAARAPGRTSLQKWRHRRRVLYARRRKQTAAAATGLDPGAGIAALAPAVAEANADDGLDERGRAPPTGLDPGAGPAAPDSAAAEVNADDGEDEEPPTEAGDAELPAWEEEQRCAGHTARAAAWRRTARVRRPAWSLALVTMMLHCPVVGPGIFGATQDDGMRLDATARTGAAASQETEAHPAEERPLQSSGRQAPGARAALAPRPAPAAARADRRAGPGSGPRRAALAELRREFASMDEDRGGTISAEELVRAKKAASRKVARAMVRRADGDGDGQIDFRELAAALGLQSGVATL